MLCMFIYKTWALLNITDYEFDVRNTHFKPVVFFTVYKECACTTKCSLQETSKHIMHMLFTILTNGMLAMWRQETMQYRGYNGGLWGMTSNLVQIGWG